jgi:hypothetical protein
MLGKFLMPTLGPDGSPVRQAAINAPDAEIYRRQLPAWLMSLGLHATFFVGLALVVPNLPQGAAEEAVRTGGIVLVRNASGPPEYLSEEDAGGSLSDDGAATGIATQATNAGGTPQQFPDVPEDLAGLLPRGVESITGSNQIGDGADSATAMAAPSGAKGPKFGDGHNYAQTGVFGVTGQGSKFVYVFDRSGSMDGFQGRPLVAAKRELLASIEKLGSVHQFQIVFYNERPTILNPERSATARLMFGTDTDKQSAQSFVRGISADGGTRHLEAIKLALKMKPHVIFFLTDADEPTLTNAELDEVRKLNDRVGASINAIEFGSGPQQNRENFLVRIARENSGAHVYVDVSQLPRK